MKRNFSLFAILILLLAGTYIFQEKRVEKEHTESHERDSLVRSEITHLKLPNIEAEKRKGQWWSGDQLLSHNTFKQIEKKLSEITKFKEIKGGEWKTYFPNPIAVEINKVPWTIGDLSLDKQGFYIARDKDIFLAFLEGGSTHLTRNAAEIEGIKLNELVSLISKPEASYFENQLFRYYPDLPLEKVFMSIEGNLPYELDFLKNATLPPPIEGVSAYKELRGKFFSLLTQATLKKEIPHDEKLKFKKLGEAIFIKGDSSVKWEMWLIGKNNADVAIIDPALKKAYLMVGGTLRMFFINIQDYWDKKVIPEKYFVQFSKLQATFTQGEKSAKVWIYNKEPFEFESPKFKIDTLKMEQLVQLIFNLGPKEQADRVSKLSSSEKKQLLSENHLRVDVMEQELIMWRKQEEVIVVNLTQGFKGHFNMLDEKFRGTFEDVLK